MPVFDDEQGIRDLLYRRIEMACGDYSFHDGREAPILLREVCCDKWRGRNSVRVDPLPGVMRSDRRQKEEIRKFGSPPAS